MASKKANSTLKQRVKMTQKMLSENPHVIHAEVNKALKAKFGAGIDFYKFRTLKYGNTTPPRPSLAQQPSGADAMKKALKMDTTKTDISEFIRDFGQVIKTTGIEKLEMTMVDGEPRFTVTERRRFEV